MINLFSDTHTQPTPAMREAMARAEVGDEQLGEDPTVNRLQERTAELLGKEAALFLPSGTMCNLIALKVHARPGDLVLCDRWSHVVRAEAGGLGSLCGLMSDLIDSPRGIFTPEALEAALPPGPSVNRPPARLLCVENTHNSGGGAVWPVEQLRAVCRTAQRHGLATHMDGARLLNAAVASGTRARDYAACVDTAWIDLSKGLGCPVGGVLAGPRELMVEARRWKQAFGGAMRQAGVLAAAGVYALEHHVDRLADDHANALLLCEGLATIPRVRVLFPVETNIVFFAVEGHTAATFGPLAEAAGVRFSGFGTRVRAVTHLDVTREDVESAVAIVRRLLA